MVATFKALLPDGTLPSVALAQVEGMIPDDVVTRQELIDGLASVEPTLGATAPLIGAVFPPSTASPAELQALVDMGVQVLRVVVPPEAVGPSWVPTGFRRLTSDTFTSATGQIATGYTTDAGLGGAPLAWTVDTPGFAIQDETLVSPSSSTARVHVGSLDRFVAFRVVAIPTAPGAQFYVRTRGSSASGVDLVVSNDGLVYIRAGGNHGATPIRVGDRVGIASVGDNHTLYVNAQPVTTVTSANTANILRIVSVNGGCEIDDLVIGDIP